MILRPYQKRVVSRAAKALEKHGNTLAVAPTGAGKTIMLSALVKEMDLEKNLVLQHRDELVNQNMAKFIKVAGSSWPVSLFTSDVKSWRGRTVFGMVQTLSRESNLSSIPKLDSVTVDEAHHVAAPTYRKILDTVLEKNPGCKIAGWTATPERGDGRGLRGVFTNMADQIAIKELIDLGFLVKPKAFVINVADAELAGLRKLRTGEFDMHQAEEALNKSVINDEVIRHWREKAGERQTVVFCSTVQHAQDVLEAFRNDGVAAEMVTGETPDARRRQILRDLDTLKIQVVVNVMVLTEGFDSPPISCVVLLRPCSFKSTMIQMIGRGLRTVNPSEYPGVVKKDCVVLDFGRSVVTHGDLTQGSGLGPETDKKSSSSLAPFKVCEECEAEVPIATLVCPFCGFEFPRADGDDSILESVELTEFDLLEQSPFRWIDLFGTGRVMMANGFSGFGCVATRDGETWLAFGKVRRGGMQTLTVAGEKVQAIAAADDFLRDIEEDNAAHKTKRWLTQSASGRQVDLLNGQGYRITNLMRTSWTKAAANAHLNFSWNKRVIEQALFSY